MVIDFTDQNFADYAAQGKPMVIDFNAEWCGPCRRMAPVIEALAQKYDGQIIVGQCNVDDNDDLASKFGIRNIPAIYFLKGTEIVDKIIGAVPGTQVEAKAAALL